MNLLMKTQSAAAVTGKRAIAIALLMLLLACSKNDADAGRRPGGGPNAAGNAPVVVTASAAQNLSWADEIAAIGTLQANESTVITAKVTETVARINFKDGEQAQAGDVLVELTGKAEVASLREAQASYREANQQYERLANVTMAGTVTRAQLDQQAAARDQAAARRDAIRARLSDRVIVAPFSGVLGFRQVSPGALVSPGTVITTLDDIRTLKLDFTVAEVQLGAVHVGDQVQALSGTYPGSTFSGRVRSIDSRIDPVTRSVQVRAQLDNADLRLKPGMLMNVALQSTERQALVVPEIAVLQNGAQAYVFKITDGKAMRADVRLGARKSGLVEIADGLSVGQLIVVEGNLKVKEGSPVTVQTPKASA